MTATTSTGVSNDTAKKRKGNPTANEIFTTVPETGVTAINGDNVQSAPKKAYVAPPKRVHKFLGDDEIDASIGFERGAVDAACRLPDTYFTIFFHSTA